MQLRDIGNSVFVINLTLAIADTCECSGNNKIIDKKASGLGIVLTCRREIEGVDLHLS